MTRKIRQRWTGAVLWSGEAETVRDALHQAIEIRADLTNADLTGANLTGANLIRADLTDADLTDADLTGANLTGANLIRADLIRADLTGANLTDADLTGANLIRADLNDADLTGANLIRVPIVPNIDSAILTKIANGGSLDMSKWHMCKTTHCRAGWAIRCAGAEGRALEDQIGSAAAGALIYAASRPGERVPNFYATNDDALADLRAGAAREATKS